MNTTVMEQTKYYWNMWGKSSSWSSSSQSTRPAPHLGAESWEEQAFAQDAAGQLGGCVWPPRSYSCSFCRREFRSAQALGGHMNVHRRDRARLRQCSSPPPATDADQDMHQLPQPSLCAPHPPRQEHAYPCSLLYRTLSNPNTSLPSRVSPASGALVVTSPPSYISTIIKESKNKILMSTTTAPKEAIAYDDEDHSEEEEGGRRKRRRIDPAVFPFFLWPSPAAPSCDREGLQAAAKVPKITSPSSCLVDQQEVDLELRLGSSPKVT